ncbi:Endoribonuclease SymE (plasmid) [Duffyella gerundensis]|uniref:SymE family type I addiction module toxin n=1 Tax=Duffyella gerundensis TaxID=1619313 RepID=UPI001CE30D37|nr:SymE family type I addiction module toxin [Duffyella gerundensis]UCB33445.1 Endoribonuclease SymE [Duffyella gerundensis]
MAKQHHKSEQISTKVRRYTAGYIRDSRKFQSSPFITLKGHLMEALGFETGHKSEVITGPGQLIIQLAEECSTGKKIPANFGRNLFT